MVRTDQAGLQASLHEVTRVLLQLVDQLAGIADSLGKVDRSTAENDAVRFREGLKRAGNRFLQIQRKLDDLPTEQRVCKAGIADIEGLLDEQLTKAKQPEK